MSKLPRIISLVPQRFEDGGFSGVPRFDWELRRALPEMISVNTKLKNRLWLRYLARREPDTIVITGNETSLMVPDGLRTIVLHHGSAQTHFDRDPSWRGAAERAFCRAQREMYLKPNRWFVALARWTAEEFSKHYRVPLAQVLPSWVEPITHAAGRHARPVVLGDFRTFNKGREVLKGLSAARPDLEFRTLQCTYEQRKLIYAGVDAYLCLSLSEGGSFSLTDAEATQLPIVMTDVGNCFEYSASRIIPWQQRDEVERVSAELDRALQERRGPRFFDSWTFEAWRRAWRERVAQVADEKGREPLLSAASEPAL
jgi:hypothetical protein